MTSSAFPLRLGLLVAALGLPGCFESRDYYPPPRGPDAGSEAPVGQQERMVRISAFNVRRFFDPVCDSGACGGSNYEALPSLDAFTARANQLSVAIASLGAGVVLVEEVENERALEALRVRLPALPWAVLGETGRAASVDVGVLSAWPITQVRGHRSRVLTRPDGSTTSFTRELLEVHLDVRGSEVIVFAAHFRSKVNDDPGRRLAEAQAAYDIVSTVALEHPSALVVLGGDLNDVPGSEPLQALEQGGMLLRVASDRPEGDTWTYLYQSTTLALDHLFLARNGGGGYLPASFRAVRDSTRGLGGSDHAAVSADFLLAPGE